MKSSTDTLERILEMLDDGKSREEIVATFGDAKEVLEIIDGLSQIDAFVKPHPAILQKAIDQANQQKQNIFSKIYNVLYLRKIFVIGSALAVFTLVVWSVNALYPTTTPMSQKTQIASTLTLGDDADVITDPEVDTGVSDIIDPVVLKDTQEILDNLDILSNSLDNSSSDFNTDNDANTFKNLDTELQNDMSKFQKDLDELSKFSESASDNFNSDFQQLIS